jgi:hypothetical protein
VKEAEFQNKNIDEIKETEPNLRWNGREAVFLNKIVGGLEERVYVSTKSRVV